MRGREEGNDDSITFKAVCKCGGEFYISQLGGINKYWIKERYQEFLLEHKGCRTVTVETIQTPFGEMSVEQLSDGIKGTDWEL